MIREAVPGDEAALENFLAQHFETTMFMRGNLRDFGLNNKTAPYAMRYFMSESIGIITGVGAVANAGNLMGHAPNDLPEIAQHMRNVLPDDMVCAAILGASDQAAIFRQVFNLTDAPTKMDDTEPLFSLSLNNLLIPARNDVQLAKPTNADQPLMADWAFNYAVEVLGEPSTDQARQRTADETQQNIKSDRLRILKQGDQIVAQTMFNAVMPDTVQIGGVYTPPDLRGQGFAKSAVALHLQQARNNGVKQAILFSASQSASNVYRAIGFRQIGTYTIILFK